MPVKAVAFSRRISSPELTGDYAMLFVMPTNMIGVETELLVGVFQGITLQDNPSAVTIDFFLSDPRPMLPPVQLLYDNGQWVQPTAPVGPGEGWAAYDQAHARAAKNILEGLHQFTIPTGPNLIGISDDLVAIQDYKWVAIRVAYSTDPSADVYVQITPQTLPVR